jgi:hypothetical protein
MKSRYLINLLLVIAIVGLYYLINHEAEVSTVRNQTLSQLKLSDVSTIVIGRQHRDSIVIIKDGSHWQIIKPIKAKANDVRVNLILNLLSTPIYSQFKPKNDMDLQQFGLNPVNLSLQLNQQRFEFGAIESLSSHRYVRYDETIYLIHDTLAPLLNSSASSFIDNRLFSKQQQLTKLELPLFDSDNQLNVEYLTLKLSDGHWTSNKEAFSNDLLTTIVDSWQNAYAMQVFTLSTEEINDLTGIKISVSYKDNSSSELIVQLSNDSLSLFNIQKQLKYQFSISIKHKLFAHTEPL